MNQKAITFEEMKTLYPDEWIFIANPVMDYTEVKSGIVIYHSKDKREVVNNNIGKAKLYESVTIKFTGTFPSRPKWLRFIRSV